MIFSIRRNPYNFITRDLEAVVGPAPQAWLGAGPSRLLVTASCDFRDLLFELCADQYGDVWTEPLNPRRPGVTG